MDQQAEAAGIPAVVRTAVHGLFHNVWGNGLQRLKLSRLDGYRDEYSAEGLEGVPRCTDDFRTKPRFSIDLSPEDAEGRSEVLYGFESKGEWAVISVGYQEYCDDNSDGYIHRITFCGSSPSERLAEAVKDLRREMQQRIETVEEQVLDVEKLLKKKAARASGRRRPTALQADQALDTGG